METQTEKPTEEGQIAVLRSGDLLGEVRAIITDQINRHVAMTDTHRASGGLFGG